MQQLSNKVVRQLKSLRARNSAIPSWAEKDPSRHELFARYGSPSVFHLYNPHFSVMDPQHLTAAQQKTLASYLKILISQFAQKDETQRRAAAYAIGVGIANHQGQIIKELAHVPL